MNDVVDPVEFAHVQDDVKNLLDMRSDVKTILSAVTDIKVRMAMTPQFTDLTPIKDRVTSLESTRDEARGAWKAMVVAGGVIGSCSGIIGALCTKIFAHPAVATATSGALTIAKHFVGK